MPVLLVTHPHNFDNGHIKNDLLKFLKSTNMKSYCIIDRTKDTLYGTKKAYTGVLEPHDDLGKYGRASLQDEHAKKIVANNKRIYLAGGNLAECLASTYRSLVRAAESENAHIEITFIVELVYAQVRKNGTVTDLQTLRHNASEKAMKYYFSLYPESQLVDHRFKSLEDLP